MITFFVPTDVKDLISTLSDGDGHGECSIIGSYKQDSTDSVCPPRVRAMLASRACRSSIMIGDALGRNEMQKVVKHILLLASPLALIKHIPTFTKTIWFSETINVRKLNF